LGLGKSRNKAKCTGRRGSSVWLYLRICELSN
jgi:hypothetical protein